MQDITINLKGVSFGQRPKMQCALGTGGLLNALNKREGDGTTPTGIYHFRRVLYRADRVAAPQTALPFRAIRRDDGWCDDPGDPAYNRPVILPFPASTEKLWRDDHVYDLIGVISHNDDPPIAGLGSAVFIHLARTDYSPTRGCIALSEADLRAVFTCATVHTAIHIG